MNKTGIKLALIATLIPGLSSCLTYSNMSQQMTILNTDCDLKDVIIRQEREDLNSTRHWIAECNGRIYQCNAHDNEDADCYEISE